MVNSSLYNKYPFLNEWNEKGAQYAKDVNEMVEFGETHGWDKWKGKEPADERSHLADDVLKALQEANDSNTVNEFRSVCPPAHTPFIKYHEEKGQCISDIYCIDNSKIVFITGAPYETRQAYLLDEDKLQVLDSDIVSVGKSPLGNCFAIAKGKKVSTSFGWQGTNLYEFDLPAVDDLAITQLIPFNDGSRVLLVSAQGIFHLSENGSQLLHPEEDPDDDEWTSSIDMEHAALSPDNSLICAGDQGSVHRILNNDLVQIADIGPQSEYPHFALFSKDNSHLIMNSCHFYWGATIGVHTNQLNSLDDESYTVIDEQCRIYAGVATSQYYIVGDASGYIRAFDTTGKKVWEHFLGSTVTGMAISEDESTLYVACYSGILHKLIIGKGKRDAHAIGNADLYEEFRLLLWKGEEKVLRW
jgi:hypothetical protein